MAWKCSVRRHIAIKLIKTKAQCNFKYSTFNTHNKNEQKRKKKTLFNSTHRFSRPALKTHLTPKWQNQ